MNEPIKQGQKNDSIPIVQANRKGRPVRDPGVPDGCKAYERYLKSLDRISKELDDYFSMRRLMPRE